MESFYVLSVSEFIIRSIRTPARRVCGSTYRYMPRSKVCIPDAMKFWKKPWRWSVTGEYDPAAEK
ncbi:hypothetical protein [Alistipes putredinis]|uniref:hypothetical protein n=1 Tax=Alistipes putredinis TaxID=28117 RepID=UPI002431D545|nr:hypothetical protein [Alistipes putredinis]MBS6651931.1 hypothetical protein [Alistipes putredinis]